MYGGRRVLKKKIQSRCNSTHRKAFHIPCMVMGGLQAITSSQNQSRRFLRAEKVRWGIWGVSYFFQAEDGIRDTSVTGVQTCALPIYVDTWLPWGEENHAVMHELRGAWRGRIALQTVPLTGIANRSEERRVGKEC